MDLSIQKEVEKLSEEVIQITEEIDLVTEADAELEDIARARTLAAAFLEKYKGLLERLGLEDKMEVQRSIGLKVERMKGKLTKVP